MIREEIPTILGIIGLVDILCVLLFCAAVLRAPEAE